MKTNQVKFKLLLVLTLVVVVWILQSIVLKLNLEYGFRDGDWWIIRRYISLGPLSLNHLINALKLHAVYTYQIYYAGFLTNLYGLDFHNLYQASHFFKFLASLAVFPMVLILTKNKMTAFLSSLIYSIAYPASGALYMFLTGAYFIAIIFLNFFFISYWVVLNQDVIKFRWILLTFILFIATILLNAERMYPLALLILVIELLWVFKNRWTKLSVKLSLIRISVFLFPLIVFYGIYTLRFNSQVNPAFFTPQFLKAIELRLSSISSGNLQLLLYPFSSFGSMFLFSDYWKLFGNFETKSFIDFIFYFISRPLLIFSVPTVFLIWLASKKPIKFILITLLPLFVFGLIIYLMVNHWFKVDPSVRIHLDTNYVGIPALFGFYVLSLSFSFFLIWLKGQDKRNLLLPIFVGAFVSFFFILLTWIGSDVQLLFVGPQRYLTTPAIGSSLILASIITLIFSRLKEIKLTRHLAWLSLLLLVPVVLINAKINKEFFSYEIKYAGMGGIEQTRMKDKFWSLVPKVSNNEESLFYFDETADKQNGYFDESTILAGFEDWIQFDHGALVVANRPYPGMLRTNIQCPEHTHGNCIKILKEGLTEQNGVWGILYKDSIRESLGQRFFKLSNFYAMRFINKDIIDIKKEVLVELEAENKAE